jgi:hypothetical protein
VPLFSQNPGGIEGYWSAKAVAGGRVGVSHEQPLGADAECLGVWRRLLEAASRSSVPG